MKGTWLAMRVAGSFSSRLGGYFAARLWFTPWRVGVSERALAKQTRWLSAADPISFDVDGSVISGYSAGDGPAVLLVHGWGERGASMGAFVEPLVKAGYRAVGIDLPGHGATSSGRTDIFELSRAVRSVANQLGGIHGLIAYSMGGYVATVSLSEGLLPAGVVLISPASNVRNALDRFTSLFRLPPRAARGLRRNIERRFGPGVWDRLDSVSLVRDFLIPALIIHDRDDQQIDLADSEALAAAWPEARLVVTRGLGHSKILRDPSVIASVIPFLAQMTSAHTPELVAALPPPD